jgi:hypothetical protein
MEGQSKVKIKVGEHTFEAEGSPEDVRDQYRMFMELVVSMPATPPPQPQPNPEPIAPYTPIQTYIPPAPTPSNELTLTKIMKADGRMIVLTIRPKSVEDAIMLVLLGHKFIRDVDSVTGSDIVESLKTTGGVAFGRIDRIMEKFAKDGEVIISGENRGKRYRMTYAGIDKAREIAQGLLALVP